MSNPLRATAEAGTALPELAALPWRKPTDRRALALWGRAWTAWTAAYVIPFGGAGLFLIYLEPLSFPVALICLAHAWIVPELYASRGANTLRPKAHGSDPAEPVAQGLLADLLGHEERELQRRTGLALERGAFGTWLIGEGGAALVTPDRRRVHCFCVRTTGDPLPPSDRIAHLLLALRSDEEGFATVANHSFAGAPWRLRRRLAKPMRPALEAALRT